MKRLIALLMAVLILSTTVYACAEPVVGGWNIAEDTSLTDEQLALFDKALSGYVGVNYWPVAYLGRQVVAGTNHCFLCTASPAVPNPGIHYVLVYIHEDLEGNAEYLDRDTISVPGEMDFVPEEPEDGSWGFVMDHTITEAHKALVAKATETLLGAKYEPVVYLSMQVVGGFNHCFLCKVTPVVPDAQAHFVIVELYDDAEGNAEIRSVDDVELGFASDTIALPAYVYPGEDPKNAAIANYFSEYGTKYLEQEGCVCIPAPVIFKTESIDESHVKVYGNFWHLNYVLEGTTLVCISGGECPAVVTLEMKDDAWTVTDVLQAEDGEYYPSSIKAFCNGDEDLEKQYFSSSDIQKEQVESIRRQYIVDYVQTNALPVDSYQDPYWPVVMLIPEE